MLRPFIISLLTVILTTPLIASAGSAAGYDDSLCQLAQRLIINDDDAAGSYALVEQRGESNGFHTIQMGVDEAQRQIIIASYYQSKPQQGADSNAIVAASCKLINRERANAQLALNLTGERRQCRDINQYSYQLALASLTASERQRYLTAGRQLVFADDYVTGTGGEWLPINVERENRYDTDAQTLTIRAPSVQVPWNDAERNFFQGVHHCKLLSKATLRNWMLTNSFAAEPYLISADKQACTAPANPDTSPGSCLFYFAPANGLFCKDYTGNAWEVATVREECSQRHASAAALTAAKNRYEGTGGIYSDLPCHERNDVPNMVSSCVFNCTASDEAVWHSMDPPASGAGAGMMSRACDLYVEY